jgi:hypothetical protein
LGCVGHPLATPLPNSLTAIIELAVFCPQQKERFWRR